MMKKIRYTLTLVLIFIFVVGCSSVSKEKPSGIEFFYQDTREAEKAELINIVGEKVSEIEDEKLHELIDIILNTKPGPYPQEYTGGEVEGGIILINGNDKINLTLAPTYIAVNDPEPKRYSLKEPHLVFSEGITSEVIYELFHRE